jgi:predicted 3-demethylubiquinone-9 3-methyltransferase (glyoxalase superfamily)
MDSAYPHGLISTSRISFIVNCKDQRDRLLLGKLAVPESEQCGWLKDKFGVSWQITPTAMDEMLANGARAQIDRVTQAFLPMKKIIIAELEKAYKGGE